MRFVKVLLTRFPTGAPGRAWVTAMNGFGRLAVMTNRLAATMPTWVIVDMTGSERLAVIVIGGNRWNQIGTSEVPFAHRLERSA
jgi:hypothetical protein